MVVWHASGAEGDEAVVLVAHRGARVVAASPKLAVLRAEGAFTGAADTLTLQHHVPRVWPCAAELLTVLGARPGLRL